MEDTSPNEPVPKSLKAKDYHERIYLPRVAKALEAMRTLPVAVFVCGPTEESEALTRKKINTVSALRDLGHDASLGEELVAELSKQDADAGSPIQTVNTYELIAALKSDLVIVFCASPGSIGETHEFLSVSTIGQKTLIFIDEQYSNSYTSVGILSSHKKLYRPLETYKSPEDIDNCTLMGKVIDWVKNYQSAKLIATLREES